MALILMEGFDTFGANGVQITSEVKDTYSMHDPSYNFYARPGRVAGLSAQWSSTSPDAILTMVPNAAPHATYIVGFGYYLPHASGVPDTGTAFALRQKGHYESIVGVGFHVASDGTVSAVTGDGSTVIVSSSAGIIQNQTWHYIEMKVYCHPSAGTVDIMVDDSTVASGTGLDTDYATVGSSPVFEGVCWRGQNNLLQYQPRIDDLYVCDGSGSINNDFLGDCVVRPLYPTSDAGTNDWTPSTGVNHYAVVDDQYWNDETDYLDTDTDADKEMFGFGTISTGDDIIGITLHSTNRRLSPSSGTLQHIYESNASEQGESGLILGVTTIRGNYSISETNPDTLSPWTEAEINAGTFGFQFDE